MSYTVASLNLRKHTLYHSDLKFTFQWILYNSYNEFVLFNFFFRKLKFFNFFFLHSLLQYCFSFWLIVKIFPKHSFYILSVKVCEVDFLLIVWEEDLEQKLKLVTYIIISSCFKSYLYIT